MKLKIYQIDAFTDKVFTGNYAAVIVLDEWISEQLMQSIATENNLSETAFAKKTGKSRYEIRWFSPLKEIDFCGHATLATAFVLFGQDSALLEITFVADAVGELLVSRLADGSIQMVFPNQKPSPIDAIPQALIDGLSIRPAQVLRNKQAYFVVYPCADDVTSVVADSSILELLSPYDIVVTAPSDRYDFVSRYFWPASGGDEDPVTGSIHAGLAPFWAEVLGKGELIAHQASSRGGILQCLVDGGKVIISGKAVKYLEGEIEL